MEIVACRLKKSGLASAPKNSYHRPILSAEWGTLTFLAEVVGSEVILYDIIKYHPNVIVEESSGLYSYRGMDFLSQHKIPIKLGEYCLS